MNSTFEPLEFVEQAAAANRYEPQEIVEIIRRGASDADFGQLAAGRPGAPGPLSGIS